MESKQKQITFYGSHPKREVVAYLLPNGNFDVYCEKLLIGSNVTQTRLSLIKSFFVDVEHCGFKIETE